MLNTLIILDGYAISDTTIGNAIKNSKTPYLDKLFKEYPNTLIGASGLDVGLPDGQMGNSEVGHINMGAGRTVYQELTRISKDIEDEEFFNNQELIKAIEHAKENKTALHTYGLLSNGGVHTHINHLFAVIKMAKMYGLDNIYVHCFMDGRDVSPTSGKDFLEALQLYMDSLHFGTIATVVGRYYAMDRDNRWERVAKAYNALTVGEGTVTNDIIESVKESYANNVTDEFIEPLVVKDTKRIQKGDSLIFFNFRPDRAREITRAFIDADFTGFERKSGFVSPYYLGFTRYDNTFTNFHVAFEKQSLSDNLGEILARNNLKQLRIAETEKYAHVTFFFNSGVETPNQNEDRVLIPSPKVATYDMQPEMSAFLVAEKAAELIKSEKYDVIILNFANCDMVGHTGVFEAATRAVEAIDKCVETVIEAVKSVNGNAIITADHGNADKMLDEEGNVFTAHSTNPVPFIVVKKGKFGLKEGGTLRDVAPTLLELIGLEKPTQMTGSSLIR